MRRVHVPLLASRGTLPRIARRCNTQCQALVTEIRDDIVSKRRSAVEVTQFYLKRLHEREARLGSFITVDDEGALKQAKAVDAAVAAGETIGALAGVPVAIKDNLCTAGLTTTAGSRILQEYVPPYDATCVSRLRAAGAVVIGKTNMDEFGMGSTTENSAFGQTRNAWSPDHVPGGSSGGSAAAVAGGQAPLALGSDTGGSVRLPAAWNGCVGIKPTYGRVSRSGLLAYASSLDCVGALARSAADAAALLSAIAGHDAADATSLSAPVNDLLASLPGEAQLPSKPLAGLRFGVLRATLGDGVAAAVRDAVAAAAERVESLGGTVTEASIPSFTAGLPAYYVLATSEASSNLARYDGVRYGLRKDAPDLRSMYGRTRASGFGAEVKRRILMGTYALSAGYYDAFYKRAQKVRTAVQGDFDRALGAVDILLSPVAPSTAYRFGEKTQDPVSMYLGDLMTVNLNLTGLPAVSVNCGFEVVEGGSTRLPIGIQLIGQRLSEGQLLRVAHILQLTHSVASEKPPMLD